MLCLCISMVSSMGPSASDGLWFSEIMQTYHDMYKPTQPINEMKRLTNLNQELITLKKQNQNIMKMMNPARENKRNTPPRYNNLRAKYTKFPFIFRI